MKVVLINEDNHGLLGVALNYYNAVKWLIGNGWIDDNTEICTGDDDHSYQWDKVKNVLGEDWADKMTDEWDIDNFNDYWEGSFLLQSEDVIGGEWLFESGSE